MNPIFEKAGKDIIKELLPLCEPGQIELFKKMYGLMDPTLTIAEIIDRMPSEQISQAISQIENTLRKAGVKHQLIPER